MSAPLAKFKAFNPTDSSEASFDSLNEAIEAARLEARKVPGSTIAVYALQRTVESSITINVTET